MGQRCTFGDHGNCTACRKFVAPTSRRHAHVFAGVNGTNEVLCAECNDVIAAAALTILRALGEAGVKYEDFEELRAILAQQVVIGVQTEAEWFGTWAN